MTLQISNGRLAGAKFVAANSYGEALKPQLIILHDTAGRLEKGNTVAWFKAKECKVSAHVVVERDGTITQMVPFNRKAFHAGASEYKGRKYCNGFAIGIEIVNPGILDKTGKAWFGPASADGVVNKATKEHGDGYWMPYTPEQVRAVKDLCRAIVAAYPDVNDITTHWAVSPGRKIDTNPLFPLEEVEDFAFGRTEPDTADVPVAAVKPPDAPPTSMATSSTGNTAITIGATGVTSSAVVMSTAVKSAAAKGSLTLGGLFWALLENEIFVGALIAGAITVGGCAYIWIERAKKLAKGV